MFILPSNTKLTDAVLKAVGALRIKEPTMPGDKPVTPIKSTAQRGLFGAELRRRRTGKAKRIPSITTADLVAKLEKGRGKKLPLRTGLASARAA